MAHRRSPKRAAPISYWRFLLPRLQHESRDSAQLFHASRRPTEHENPSRLQYDPQPAKSSAPSSESQ